MAYTPSPMPGSLEQAGQDDTQVVDNTVAASQGDVSYDPAMQTTSPSAAAEPEFEDVKIPLGIPGAQRMLGEEANKAGRMSRKDVGDRRGILKSQQQAVDADMNAELAIQNDPETSRVNAQRVRDSAMHQAALARSVELRQKALNQFDALDKMSTDLANQRIENPFANRTLGERIFSIAAQAFGGFVSGAFGGPNIPAQMIDQAVRQDLAIQRWNMQHGQDSLQNKRGLLNQMMDHFGDVDKAEAAAYTATMDALNKRMDMVASKYKGQKIVAAAQSTKAELAKLGQDKIDTVKQHYEQQQVELKKTEAQLAATKYSVDSATQRASMRPGPTPLEFTEYSDQKGQPGVARNAKEYADVQKIHDTTLGAAGGFRDLADFAAHMNRKDVTDQGILRQKLSGIFNEMRQLVGTGANLSANEEQNINAMLPGFFEGNLAPEHFRRMLQSLADRQVQKSLSVMKGRGFMPNQQNQLMQIYMSMHPELQSGQNAE